MDWVFCAVRQCLLSCALFRGGLCTLFTTGQGKIYNCVRVLLCGPEKYRPLQGMGIIPSNGRGYTDKEIKSYRL
jgi:hypothetical protein